MPNLNLLSIIVLIVMVLYIRYMIKQEDKMRERILKIQLIPVLLYNIGIHIVQWGKLPVEFSTINYFIITIIVLTGIKKLEVWAVYAAFMAGFFYFLLMVLFGDSVYGHFPPYSVYTSLYNHGSLVSYAIIKLATTPYERNQRLILWGGLGFCIVWALALQPFVNPVIQPGRIFVYEILYAYLVRYTIPATIPWGYPLYYIGLYLFLDISTRAVYWINRAFRLKQA